MKNRRMKSATSDERKTQKLVARGKPGAKEDLWAHGYGRASLERMMKIHRKIADGEYPNCRRMSGEFEMSVRTLKRDIEFMKDRLKMPIALEPPPTQATTKSGRRFIDR